MCADRQDCENIVSVADGMSNVPESEHCVVLQTIEHDLSSTKIITSSSPSQWLMGIMESTLAANSRGASLSVMTWATYMQSLTQ